ncbi:MAG: 6-carboxytetrahydropterin synthase QueD [Syntrophobacteraceae bacterium]
MSQGFFELKVLCNFAAAHNLREFRGKCENLHGHNWKVEVVLRGKSLQSNGILVDFGEVKAEVRAVLEELDHRYLNELPYFTTNNPSSENITRFLFEKLADKLTKGDTRLYSVTAWESEDACATYTVSQ